MLIALTFTAAILSVLLVAAVSKVAARDGGPMAAAITALWPFPRTPSGGAARVLGVATVALELALVGCLGTGLALLVAGRSAVPLTLAALASAVLFATFAAVELVALRRGRRPVCACFGARSVPISAVGTTRTAVLALLGLVTAAIYATAPAGARPASLDLVVALCIGVVLGTILIGADEIADILKPTPGPARRP